MEPELTGEFCRVFQGQSSDALAYAFACWREISQFLPAISDIRGFLKVWHRNKVELEGKAKQKADLEKLEEGRANGQVVDLVDLKMELAHICQMPEAPTAQQQNWKLRQERARLASMPPPIVLTIEQITARTEKEREEIRREVDRAERLKKQNEDGIYKQEDNS